MDHIKRLRKALDAAKSGLEQASQIMGEIYKDTGFTDVERSKIDLKTMCRNVYSFIPKGIKNSMGRGGSD